jgi:very-short-patch-repair endonuclease
MSDKIYTFSSKEVKMEAEASAKNNESSKGKENQNSPLEGCPKGGVEINESSKGKEFLTTINSIPIYRNFVNNLPYNPDLKKFLKAKRKMGILSEVLFWLQVHKKKIHKIDFDRQRIIGNYIVDFYVKSLGLVIEIDGASHHDKVEYDAIRQEFLESFGLKVYRINDLDVKIHLHRVMQNLEEYIIREFSNYSH